MKLTLRDYQAEAIEHCWQAIADGMRAPLLIEPTGSGKALIIASLCEQANEFDPTVRIVILTDSQELVGQNFAEFIGLWPNAPAGVYSAGLNRRDIGARFLFASIQSIYKRAFKIQRCDILIIDECHMIPPRSDAMYGQFIKDLRIINPNLVIIGATATNNRLGSGRLDEGDDALFDGVAHETPVKKLIDEGYLAAPRTPNRMLEGQINTKGVGTRLGEFIQGQLEAAAMDQTCIDAVVDHTIKYGQGREGWKIFGVSVKHCEAIHEALAERGYIGGCVFGHTDKAERRQAIRNFSDKSWKYLVSNMTLIKGFNVKHISMIVLAFSTKSLVKYIQSVGRGTRPLYAPGYDLSTIDGRLAAIDASEKPDCLVLDMGGNVGRFGPFDDPFPEKPKGKGGGDAPIKTCEECTCECHAAVRVCPVCGTEFPAPESTIRIVPDAKPILSVEPEWLPVSAVTYKRHSKPGGTDSMKVTYQVGLSFHSEWICLDHVGFPRSKAETWWRRRDAGPIPRTVAEALEIAEYVLARPSHIRVKREGKYDRIVGYQFQPQAVAA